MKKLNPKQLSFFQLLLNPYVGLQFLGILLTFWYFQTALHSIDKFAQFTFFIFWTFWDHGLHIVLYDGKYSFPDYLKKFSFLDDFLMNR